MLLLTIPIAGQQANELMPVQIERVLWIPRPFLPQNPTFYSDKFPSKLDRLTAAIDKILAKRNSVVFHSKKARPSISHPVEIDKAWGECPTVPET